MEAKTREARTELDVEIRFVATWIFRTWFLRNGVSDDSFFRGGRLVSLIWSPTFAKDEQRTLKARGWSFERDLEDS